jgi:DNA end-binding protein Ku
MKRKNMVGLGRVVISRRERIVMLEPFDKGLIATTLHYAYEIRNAAEYFEDIPEIKLPGEMVALAEHILETKAGHFDASEFEDRYETAVVEMLKRKQAGLPAAEQTEVAAPTKSREPHGRIAAVGRGGKARARGAEQNGRAKEAGKGAGAAADEGCAEGRLRAEWQSRNSAGQPSPHG